MNKKTCAELFMTFFKIGLFTFGGGYAMIPLIQREAAENKRWVSEEDITEIVAIAESTPGPIAINAATFIGRRTAGLPGAACATVGVVLPSFLIISLLSTLLLRFGDHPVVRAAFLGIRAGVLALIVRALYTIAKKLPRTPKVVLIAGGAFLCAGILGVNAFLVILGCAAVGLATYLAAEGRKKS